MVMDDAHKDPTKVIKLLNTITAINALIKIQLKLKINLKVLNY